MLSHEITFVSLIKSITMKYINKILSLILLSLCLQVNAQDLIMDTKAGFEYSAADAPNRLAQMIETEKNSGSFDNISPFTVSEKNYLAETYNQHVTDAAYLELNENNLTNWYNSRTRNISVEIPVATGQSFELELTRVRVTAEDFQIKINGGEPRDYDAFPGLFYRGIIKGQPNSLAALSIYNDHVRAMISDKNGNYVLAKLSEETETYILYNDRNLTTTPDFSCEVEESDIPKPHPHDEVEVQGRDQGDCISVYVEADNAMYIAQGSSFANVGSYITALMNEVATIYANEGITVTLATYGVWTIADPYAAMTTTGAILPAFRNNNPNHAGDLAHFITTRSIGGGRAYLDQLCGDSPYAVSGSMSTSVTPVPTYSWSIMVFTHEMGHNLGSGHTHSCLWNAGGNTQIDDCGNIWWANDGDPGTSPASCYNAASQIVPANGGTIMSYCHLNNVGINFTLGFGPQPGNLIRTEYYNANCLTACSAGCPDDLILTTTYGTNANVDIEADNTISASNIIQGGGTVDYDAGSSITLTAGFHVQDGIFNAFIDGCGGARVSEGHDNNIIITEGMDDLLETAILNSTDLRVFPNPFSSNTTIEIDLPEDTEVSLHVFNLNGQMIAPLLDRVERLKGSHQINFNASHLPAGMYYCILKAGSETRTQKLAINR